MGLAEHGAIDEAGEAAAADQLRRSRRTGSRARRARGRPPAAPRVDACRRRIAVASAASRRATLLSTAMLPVKRRSSKATLRSGGIVRSPSMTILSGAGSSGVAERGQDLGRAEGLGVGRGEVEAERIGAGGKRHAPSAPARRSRSGGRTWIMVRRGCGPTSGTQRVAQVRRAQGGVVVGAGEAGHAADARAASRS